MLTPKPVYPGRILLARRGWRGMGQITLPSRTTPSAMAGGAAFTRRGLWGLGQDSTDLGLPSTPISTAPDITSIDFPTTGGTAPTVTPASPVSSGINWNAILGTAITSAAKTTQQLTNPFAPSNLPAGTSYQMTPYGTTVMTAGSTPIGTVTGLNATTLNNMLPILLVGGALVLFMSMAKK